MVAPVAKSVTRRAPTSPPRTGKESRKESATQEKSSRTRHDHASRPSSTPVRETKKSSGDDASRRATALIHRVTAQPIGSGNRPTLERAAEARKRNEAESHVRVRRAGLNDRVLGPDSPPPPSAASIRSAALSHEMVDGAIVLTRNVSGQPVDDGEALPSPEVVRAEEATEQARQAHADVDSTPPPTSGPAADALTQKRETAREATRDAVIAQQQANEAAAERGEPLPYPAVEDLPDAESLTPQEANDAVARSGDAIKILGRPMAVVAPEQQAERDARDLTRESGSAQTEVLIADQELARLEEQGLPDSALNEARERLRDAKDAATVAAQNAIEAQQHANEVARREGQPVPFSDADDISEELLADPDQLNLHLSTLPQSQQKSLIGAHLQVDTVATDAAEATVAATEAQQALADSDPSLDTYSQERIAAEQATVDAVKAQIAANQRAADQGLAVPYPAVDNIPEHFVDNPAELSLHIARQSEETQRAILGTESALSEQVYQQDLEDARQAAANGGAGSAQAIENVAARYEGNPERVDQLISDLDPEIRSLTEGLVSNDDAQEIIESLGRAAELGTTEGADRIADAIVETNELEDIEVRGRRPGEAERHAERRLGELVDAIGKAEDGRGIALGTSLANRLDEGGSPQLAGVVRDEVVNNLERLTEQTEEAAEARAEADAQLGTDLRDFSFLNEQERADYISAFQQDNIEAYTGEADAAARLDEVLARSGDALDELVVRDPESADEVVDAYAELADSSLPGRALEWATKEQPEAVQNAYADEAERILDDVVLPATSGTLLQYQAEAGGDEVAALDRFEELFGDAKLGKSVIGHIDDIKGAGTLQGLVTSAQETIQVLRALPTPEGRAEYNRLLREKAESGRPYGLIDGAFAGVGFAFAVRNYGDAEGFVDEVTENISLANNGVDILARGIDTLNEMGRLGFLSADAVHAGQRFSRFAGRTVPYVNVALNAVATVDSVAETLRDPSGGAIVQTVGDSLSLVGAVTGTFPPAKPFSAVLEFGGVALSEIGAYWAGAGERNRIDDEQQARLERVFENRYPGLREELGEEGFSEAIRQTADASDPRADQVADAANLNTEQLLRLFGTVDDSNNRSFNPALEYAEAHGLEGDDFVEFAQELNEIFDGSYRNGGGYFLDVVRQIGLNPDQALEAARQLEDGLGVLSFFATLSTSQSSADPAREPYRLALSLEGAGVDLASLGFDIETLRVP